MVARRAERTCGTLAAEHVEMRTMASTPGRDIFACFYLFIVIPGIRARCSNIVAPRITRYRIQETNHV
jgi:hypothetical protein